MDIVYILGRGSIANNLELRYSMRSLERYCQDLGKIYIVGEQPEFISDDAHIVAEDSFKKPWQNALYKIREACKDERISDEFLLMNDDFFAFGEFASSELPFYFNRRGDGGVNGLKDFAVHAPLRIKKDWYLQMPLTPDMNGHYSPRSFYCNFYKAPPTPYRDVVIRMGDGMPSIEEQIGDSLFATIDDVTMNDAEFRQFMEEVYPEKCSFEIA